MSHRIPKTLTSAETEQGGPSGSRDRRVSLLLYHRDGAKVVPLSQGVPVIIGRAWPSDAVVRDIKLSRQHARFTWEGEEIIVEDLDSTNGTRLNGELVHKARVAAGDEVHVGSVLVSLHVLTPREEEVHTLDGHDRFLARLEDEVLRARTFRRVLSVLMVSSGSRCSTHVRHFLPGVRAALRKVDSVGLYGPDTVLVTMPETGSETAVTIAQQIVRAAREDGRKLHVGVAEFPATASTAEELIAAARSNVRLASPEAPVWCVAPAQDGVEKEESGSVVIRNPQMRALYATAARVARSTAPVLIVGETGTGKELVARAIHNKSPRLKAPLRSINCGAIPATLIESTLFGHERGAFTGAERRRAGLFEEAEGGTVFLDEVGELPAPAQVALLRVLETKKLSRVGSPEEIAVDVRIVAATHRDLEAMSESGDFRLDLLYRLNTITLDVPPLRERRDEIEPLVVIFAEEAARNSDLAPRTVEESALSLLRNYDWPGNVRELRNVIERAVVIAQSDVITVDDLPERVRLGEVHRPTEPVSGADRAQREQLEFKARVRQYETELILDALRRAEGNQTVAAKLLRMPLRTLVHKIKNYGITKKYER